MKRLTGLAFAVFLVAAGSPLSNGPPPSGGNAKTQQQPDTGQKTQDTGANTRGTELAPLVVQIAQPVGHETIATKAEDEPHGYANPDWWVAGATLALAAVTAGLWWVTYLLWSSTKILVGDEQRNVKKELRAYINIKEGGARREIADITVQNFGQTPAYDVTFWADAKVCERGAAPNAVKPADAMASPKIVVGPQGTFKITPNIRDISKSWPAGTQVEIFAFGVITYRDAFEEELKVTEFYLAKNAWGDGPFHHHGEHNKAT